MELGVQGFYDVTENDVSNFHIFFRQKIEFALSNEFDAARYTVGYKLIVDTEDKDTYEKVSEENIEDILLNVRKATDLGIFIVGNQLVSWGEGVIIPILDIVNSRNITDPKGFYNADTKIPAPMVNAEFTFGNNSLQALYIPFNFRTPVPEEINDLTIKDKPQYEFPLDSEYGLRYKHYFDSGLDLRFYYLNHYPRIPAFVRTPFAEDHDIIIEENRFNTTGMSFSYATYEYIYKGDFAYHDAYPAATISDEIETSPVLQGVLGADYSFGDQNSFGLELHWDHWVKLPDALNENAFVADNKSSADLFWIGSNTTLNFFNNYIESQLIALRGLTNNDTLVRLISDINLTDHQKISLEAQKTHAERESPKFMLQQVRRFLVRYGYSF